MCGTPDFPQTANRLITFNLFTILLVTHMSLTSHVRVLDPIFVALILLLTNDFVRPTRSLVETFVKPEDGHFIITHAAQLSRVFSQCIATV